jgi:hypothetical protein
MGEIVWPQHLIDAIVEMPDREQTQILQKVAQIEAFPEMYPVRTSGPFRGHRWFLAGSWIVYYRVLEGKVYMRSILPARIP